MNISPTRPRFAFSCTFNPGIFKPAVFSSNVEKLFYNSSKEKIQSSFIDKNGISSEVVINTSPSAVSLSSIDPKRLERLVTNIESRGFDVIIEATPHDSETTSNTLKISLPETDKVESDRASPGWHESFRASTIKRDLQERAACSTSAAKAGEAAGEATQRLAIQSYKKTASAIEHYIRQEPDLAFHKFLLPNSYPSLAANWLIQDLHRAGFNASHSENSPWGSSILISNPLKETS